MRIVKVRQAEVSLANLVEALEEGLEREILIERDGRPVARLVPIDAVPVAKRIGVAKGKFEMPECMDACDVDVEQLFLGEERRP